jgi:hypothetical protein
LPVAHVIEPDWWVLVIVGLFQKSDLFFQGLNVAIIPFSDSLTLFDRRTINGHWSISSEKVKKWKTLILPIGSQFRHFPAMREESRKCRKQVAWKIV